MKKSNGSFTLVAILALTVATSLHAERTGCNPHPQAVAASTTLDVITGTILNLLSIGF